MELWWWLQNFIFLLGMIWRERSWMGHGFAYSMHLRSIKMDCTLQEFYWLSGIKREIVEFIARCLVCQQIKAERQKLLRLLQHLPISEWKWEHITIDFIFNLFCTWNEYDSIWIIVDLLTKSMHFLPICKTYFFWKLVEIFVNEIMS